MNHLNFYIHAVCGAAVAQLHATQPTGTVYKWTPVFSQCHALYSGLRSYIPGEPLYIRGAVPHIRNAPMYYPSDPPYFLGGGRFSVMSTVFLAGPPYFRRRPSENTHFGRIFGASRYFPPDPAHRRTNAHAHSCNIPHDASGGRQRLVGW
jgi:hypothetical protein